MLLAGKLRPFHYKYEVKDCMNDCGIASKSIVLVWKRKITLAMQQKKAMEE